MDPQPKPWAAIVLERNGTIVKRMGPGSGFPKNEDGRRATQEQFEEFLGMLHQQGYPWFPITAGWKLDPERGDQLILLTNDEELETARGIAQQCQAVEDFVYGFGQLIESGAVVFNE